MDFLYGICFSVNRFGKPFIKLLIHARRVNKGPFAFFLAAASDLGPEKQGMVYRMQRATPREGHGPRRANGIMGKEGYGVGVRAGRGSGGTQGRKGRKWQPRMKEPGNEKWNYDGRYV